MPSRVCSRYTEDQSIREMFSLKVEFENYVFRLLTRASRLFSFQGNCWNRIVKIWFVTISSIEKKNSCCQWYSVISIQAMDSVRISLNGNSERVEIYSSLKYMIEIQTTRLNKPLFVSLFLSVSLSVRPHSIRTQWPFNWIVRSSA